MPEIPAALLNKDTQFVASVLGMEAAIRLAEAASLRRRQRSKLHLCSIERIKVRLAVDEVDHAVREGLPYAEALRRSGITDYQYRYHTGQIRGRGPAKA